MAPPLEGSIGIRLNHRRCGSKQVLKVCDADSAFSINDYGCGYGALSDFLVQRGYSVQYRGFDVSDQMIAEAKKLHRRLSNCDFFREESSLTVADYTVASGVFNVKLRATDDEWERYFLRTLERIAELSSRGFAFNALTKYSDRDRMRPTSTMRIRFFYSTIVRGSSLDSFPCCMTITLRIHDYSKEGLRRAAMAKLVIFGAGDIARLAHYYLLAIVNMRL